MQSPIRVLGIAPYEGMKTLMANLAEEYPQVNLTLFVGDRELGLEIARRSTVAMTIGRQAYYKMVNMTQESAMAYAKATLLNLLWTEDAQEAARARRDSRKPEFIGK